MQFKIDENLPAEIAALLADAGYDAKTVFEQKLQGAKDAVVMDVCKKEDRILVTLDADFADIRAYSPQDSPGIIVLRISRQGKNFILEIFKGIIPLFGREVIKKHLWIVEENRVRIRGN